jgi:peptidoglycan/LPS O-acetylase OafA/YrhL
VLLGRLLDNRVSRYIATISFGIYIWHYLVMELIRLYWEPGFVYGNISDMSVFLTLCAAVTAISVLLGHLSWRLVEKPAIDWARRRESAPSARLAPQAAQ